MDQNPEPPPRQFPSTEKIISYSAIFISILTLLTFIYQTDLMKRQNELSVLPYLSVSTSTNLSNEASFSIVLENQGVGPAILESRKIYYLGKEYNSDLTDFLIENIEGLDQFESVTSSSIDRGTVITPNEEVVLFGLIDSAMAIIGFQEKLEKMIQDDFDFDIVYRSIYDEFWRITNNINVPEKL